MVCTFLCNFVNNGNNIALPYLTRTHEWPSYEITTSVAPGSFKLETPALH